MKEDKRIRIITGHYGSGKTEFAVNYTFNLARQGYKTAIVDLDIVNPYFRSREIETEFEEKGIRIIFSSIRGLSGDVPALSSEIYTVLEDKSYQTVIDVGGDKAGATALGRYYDKIDKDDYDMFFVLNANRPLTADRESAIRYLKSIEEGSRQKVTALVNNTHLCGETKIEDIIKGQELCLQVSEEMGLPIKYTVVHKSLINYLPDNIYGQILPIDIYMKKPWEM
ncbi:MAG: ATP-binding protein [Clostridiales bacterium]|nr:ATP-binding protein [Clostridiales bacterium]